MTAKRFTVDSDGKYWDTVSKKYVTIDHLFYLVEKLEKENEQLKQFKKEVYKIIDENIKVYETTTTNDEFLQIQIDTKLKTFYNLRKAIGDL